MSFSTRNAAVLMSAAVTGNVDAWQLDRSTYRRLSLLKTASGARTSLFVPDLDRLFVAARAGFFGLGSDAAILVLRPAD